MSWKDFARKMQGLTSLGTSTVISHGQNVVVVNGQVVSGNQQGAGIKGKGPVVGRPRAGLDNFDRIDTSIMCDVTIRVEEGDAASHEFKADGDGAHPFRTSAPHDDGFRVTVTAQENLQKVVRTEVRGTTLHLYTTESYQSSERMRVEIEMPKLVELTSSGHGNVDVGNVHGASFTLDHSGMGSLTIRGRAGHLAADISGHGKVRFEVPTQSTVLNHSGMGSLTLRGATESLVAHLSGHGSIDLSGSPTPWLHLMASGMGTVQVCCTGAAKGSITGMGSVRVHGKPTDWKVRQDGIGSVNFV